MPSSTSCPTTTTTSPRRTSPRATPTSRRTPRSTMRSTSCATPRPIPCLPGRTYSSWRACRASTVWVRPTTTGRCTSTSRPGPRCRATIFSMHSSICSTSGTTWTSTGALSGFEETSSRCFPSTRRSERSGSSSSATRSRASPRSIPCAERSCRDPREA